MKSKAIIYHIDNDNKITFVNDEWDRFAYANSGDQIISSRILQRHIMDFIVDESTRHLYQKMFRKTREGKVVEFTLRCDSPKSRRLLYIKISPLNAGGIEFRSNILTETTQNCPELTGHANEKTGELLRACAWCNKIYMDEEWIEIEEAAAKFPLFHKPNLPFITHGICEKCFEKMDSIGNQ